MRITKAAGLILMLVVAGGLVFAEAQTKEKQEEKVKEQTQPNVQEAQRQQPSMNPAGRGGAMTDREQMYRERMAQQKEAHKASLKELEDIKKIAEEEGATKTAEAIQELIDKRDAEFRKNLEQFERARKERAAQLSDRVKKDTPETEAIKLESKKADKKQAE